MDADQGNASGIHPLTVGECVAPLTLGPMCPGCGRSLERCPCCGRKYAEAQPTYPTYPFYPTWPNYPPYPWPYSPWVVTTTGTDRA